MSGAGEAGPSSITRVTFTAGTRGEWRVETVRAIAGETLPVPARLSRIEGTAFAEPPGDTGQRGSPTWCLRGVRSHDRYVERDEKSRLAAVQEALGRPSSRAAVLIPLRKTAAWWNLAQDERRAIFEAKSRHIAIGSRFLPAIARRLYHARDLGEPFDFLTWFEFAPADAGAFDDLLGRLRETEEWRYVDREIELRLTN